jgi:predicted transcriptional regulator of viral defense system
MLRFGRSVITTSEATAVWQTSGRTAGRRLKAMDEGGLVRRLRRGLWALDPQIPPFAVAPFLTAPFPAYISFWSALAHHQMIEQIPRQVSVASLDRARTIATTVGTYEIHHLAPEVFDGFDGSEEGGYLATPEKALFDAVYIRAASGSTAFFPELSLPAGFKEAESEKWTERIEGARLRTIVSRRLGEVLGVAQRAGP